MKNYISNMFQCTLKLDHIKMWLIGLKSGSKKSIIFPANSQKCVPTLIREDRVAISH